MSDATMLLRALVEAWHVYSDDAEHAEVLDRIARLDAFHAKVLEVDAYLATAADGHGGLREALLLLRDAQPNGMTISPMEWQERREVLLAAQE
jgi:hypothetical protein